MKFPAPAVLAVVLCGAGAVAPAARPAVFPRDAGASAVYRIDALTETERGTIESTSRVTLARRGRYDIEADIEQSGTGDQFLAGYVDRDGSVQFPSNDTRAPAPLLHLNVLALLAGGAPSAPAVGDTWSTKIKQIVPGDELDMPMSVRVTKAGDSGLELEADGTLKTTLTSSNAPVAISDDANNLQQPVPLTLVQHVTLRFVDGMLAAAAATQSNTYDAKRVQIKTNSSWTLNVEWEHPVR